ncbi:hypothetical protein BY996DRAFT_6552106, partial [Phakopsora pachyrhizi]
VEDFDLIDSDIIGSDQEEPRPIFLLYRLGDRADGKWILISYVPDHARVREKMIYASTHSNFGKAYFATSKDELTPAGYQIHKRQLEEPVVMERFNRLENRQSSSYSYPYPYSHPIKLERQHYSSFPSNSDENQGSMLMIVDCAVVRLTDEVRVRTSLSNTITTTTTTTDDDDDDDNSSTSDNTTSNETVTQPSTASSISSFCQNIATHSTSSNLTRIVIRPINLTQELNISTISLTYTTDSVIINQLTRSTGSRNHTHSEQRSNLSVALTVVKHSTTVTIPTARDSLLSKKFEPILDQDDSETDDYN